MASRIGLEIEEDGDVAMGCVVVGHYYRLDDLLDNPINCVQQGR